MCLNRQPQLALPAGRDDVSLTVQPAAQFANHLCHFDWELHCLPDQVTGGVKLIKRNLDLTLVCTACPAKVHRFPVSRQERFPDLEAQRDAIVERLQLAAGGGFVAGEECQSQRAVDGVSVVFELPLVQDLEQRVQDRAASLPYFIDESQVYIGQVVLDPALEAVLLQARDPYRPEHFLWLGVGGEKSLVDPRPAQPVAERVE